jgi:hypothetical protein
MNDADYLVSKGWRLVRKINGYSPTQGERVNWQAWEHPDHQPDERGFFQKGEAVAHQKRLDKGFTCDCIRAEQERTR